METHRFFVLGVSYITVELKHCANVDYGKYGTLLGAKLACSSDENCTGVYDNGCNNAGDFSLCPNPFSAETSKSSCLYLKKGNHILYVTCRHLITYLFYRSIFK